MNRFIHESSTVHVQYLYVVLIIEGSRMEGHRPIEYGKLSKYCSKKWAIL